MSPDGSELGSHARSATRLRERAVSAVKTSGEYSERLGALARFTVRHKTFVIGAWGGLAVGRGVLSVLGELGMPVSQFTVAFDPRRGRGECDRSRRTGVSVRL